MADQLRLLARADARYRVYVRDADGLIRIVFARIAGQPRDRYALSRQRSFQLLFEVIGRCRKIRGVLVFGGYIDVGAVFVF